MCVEGRWLRACGVRKLRVHGVGGGLECMVWEGVA